ncbi:nad dependent epimerase dehydratase [Pyrenophora seminiperda CCB06]|uniref:Nad dependent epimerase dehydratase n=1 Tax=Pyrenophora seminiperda CCB06 TaxID=1302712 RepID=A0A3M7M1W0_9PLEO|nr:nad dependent epimerase dehydratase [Pyrenophora seminiperda CCB06]
MPIIFGEGTGLFNRLGRAVPVITKYVVQHGHGWKINDTANFDWVHIVDVAKIYVLLVRTILEREDRGVGYLPSGRNGVMFTAVGRTTISDISQKCLDVAFAEGVLPREDTPKEKEIRTVELGGIAEELTGGRLDVAERGWAGYKATKAVLARKLLGWQPEMREEAWERDFMDELVALREGRRGVEWEECIAAGRKE